jgi:hypothetical protein
MPRVCSRAGCGKALLQRDGTPDYRRHFCGDQCSRADRRERIQAERARLKTGRCPTCGHLPAGARKRLGREGSHGGLNRAGGDDGKEVSETDRISQKNTSLRELLCGPWVRTHVTRAGLSEVVQCKIPGIFSHR